MRKCLSENTHALPAVKIKKTVSEKLDWRNDWQPCAADQILQMSCSSVGVTESEFQLTVDLDLSGL